MKPHERFDLHGKVAIVTGASRGLGREIAETLAGAGANVAMTSRHLDQVTAAAVEVAKSSGSETLPLEGDVGESGVAEKLVQATVANFGGLDIVVNNAGINIRGPIQKLTPADFDKVIGTNLKGPWLLCRASFDAFKERKSGRVINIASALGMVGLVNRSLYCASKGALVQLTRELADEWAEMEVTVNALCPGPFETEMNQPLIQDVSLYREFADFTALGRWGKRGEIGPLVQFLASDAASYVTGAIIPVDGGWTAT